MSAITQAFPDFGSMTTLFIPQFPKIENKLYWHSCLGLSCETHAWVISSTR